MRIVDGRINSNYIPTGTIVKSDINDEVVEKIQISTYVPASDTFKWIADSNYTIVHVTFHNLGTSAYTSAGSIKNGANTVVSSSDNLGPDAVEEKEGASLSNTGVSDGNEVDLIAGDQNSFITVTMTKKVNT